MILCSGGRFQQGQGTAWIALLDISNGQAPANFIGLRIELPGSREVLDGSTSLSRLKQRQSQVVMGFGIIRLQAQGLSQRNLRSGGILAQGGPGEVAWGKGSPGGRVAVRHRAPGKQVRTG